MSTPPRTGRGPAELGVRTQLLMRSATVWTLARFGDPLATLLDAPGHDPFPIYERVRARGPLVRSRLGVWTTADHALCGNILKDKRFGVRHSDGTADPMNELVDLDLSLLELDPPDHSRIRRLAAPAFRPRKLQGYRDRIEAVTDALLDEVSTRDEFDLVRDFATPLPIRVIAELLDLAGVETAKLQQHGAVLAGALDGIRNGKQLTAMRTSVAELDTLFTSAIAQRRRAPGSDIISELVSAMDAGELTDGELSRLCHLLLIAGFETTVNLISNGTLALVNHPDQWSALRANPELAEAVVEETLRWNPPVHATIRVAQEPVRIAGHDLPTDSNILTLLAGAGRDPAVHAHPDTFDVTRPDRGDHLAFSGGIHFCLGAPLARMEAEAAFRGLARRLPGLLPAGAPTRRPTAILHGLASLPLTVDSREARSL